ncbi:MAG: hypothetical protein HY801_04110 [Candidatus Lindowbacteria bacterium]|nr:hypothetical protein [Candidatus Lindowbacteria bacterium]
MLGTEEQKKLNIAIKTHWLIYLSFTSALIIYTFVVFLVVKGGSAEPGKPGILREVFFTVSMIFGVAKFWIQSRLLGGETSYEKCQNIDAIIQKYQSYNFIMLALCEVPALLGLISTFMARRIEVWWLFFAVSAILFATSAPQTGKLQSIIQNHAARHQQ